MLVLAYNKGNVYVTQFSNSDRVPQDNLDHTLTFNHSSFCYIVQEVNEIWYPGRATIKFLRY